MFTMEPYMTSCKSFWFSETNSSIDILSQALGYGIPQFLSMNKIFLLLKATNLFG